MTHEDELLALWHGEEQAPFIGWDFSHLDRRMLEDQAPWSYSTSASELLRAATSVVDLGTGGGERLLKLREWWPARVVVTEDYAPNVRLARERLAPLGVEVFDVPVTDAGLLPFSDASFDIVLNRHSGFNPAEVSRVLVPGGAFLTQQIHARYAADLGATFGATPPYPDATPAKYVPRLQAAGLEVTDVREWSGKLEFTDVGAIVYYLRAVPWLVPGFSVASHVEQLMLLQERLERGERLIFTASKYLIEAHKEH